MKIYWDRTLNLEKYEEEIGIYLMGEYDKCTKLYNLLSNN